MQNKPISPKGLIFEFRVNGKKRWEAQVVPIAEVFGSSGGSPCTIYRAPQNPRGPRTHPAHQLEGFRVFFWCKSSSPTFPSSVVRELTIGRAGWTGPAAAPATGRGVHAHHALRPLQR